MANGDAAATGTTSVPGDRAFFGHPKGLAVLFFAEMWERFSYYGMRGLLVIYLTQHFLFSDEKSALMYGAYTALVYIMTIVGGSLADRYLGSRKAVTFGAILLVAGHFGMAFEGSGSKEILTHQGADYELTLDGRGGDAPRVIVSDAGRSTYSFDGDVIIVDEPRAVGLPARLSPNAYDTRIEREPIYVWVLYLSLALIISGVGYLKANISTIVGALYDMGDKRRDSGFTIFYMGINLGSFLASLACGYLGIAYGWKYGFGLAGIGMALGLVGFLAGQPWLQGRADPPDPVKLKEKVFLFLDREWLSYLAGIGMIAVSLALVLNSDFFGTAVGRSLVLAVGIGMLGFLGGYAILKCDPTERDRMIVAIYLMLAQIPFWALFEQAGSSLNLFTDRLVDRDFFGWTVPAPMFQSLNAGYIILFAPIIAWLWIKLAKIGREPSTPVKFALGVFLTGLGFLALVAGMTTTGAAALTPMAFVFLIYWLHTMGELTLSPVGLSAITKLSPARIVGTSMGAWFLYIGLSNFLAGVIAAGTGAETIGGQITDPEAAKANYAAVYSNVGYLAVGISAVMLAIAPFMKKLMRGAD